MGEVRRVLHFARPLQKKKKKKEWKEWERFGLAKFKEGRRSIMRKVERLVRDLGERKEEGRVGF